MHRGGHYHYISSTQGHDGEFVVFNGSTVIPLGSDSRPGASTVVYNTYWVNGAPAAEPAPAPAPRLVRNEDLPTFDPGAARSALNAIDVSACTASGAPRGYGHAKVVWNPDGSISKVIVDEPSGLSAEAAKCIGDRFGTATVKPFRGGMVSVGATYFVP